MVIDFLKRSFDCDRVISANRTIVYNNFVQWVLFLRIMRNINVECKLLTLFYKSVLLKIKLNIETDC